MATAERVLRIAREQIGTTEKPPDSNNVKYNTWYYGREVNGASYPWCMVFVQWVFARAGVALPVKTASCGSFASAAKTAGIWVTEGFAPGDVVIYDFSGGKKMTTHCGIVEAVGDGYIMAIEGNTGAGSDANGGSVMERKRATRLITGAVRPHYLNMDDMIESMTDKQLVRFAERMQAALGRLPVSKTMQGFLAESKGANITDGSNPNAYCTRLQAAIMAWRAVQEAKN